MDILATLTPDELTKITTGDLAKLLQSSEVTAITFLNKDELINLGNETAKFFEHFARRSQARQALVEQRKQEINTKAIEFLVTALTSLGLQVVQQSDVLHYLIIVGKPESIIDAMKFPEIKNIVLDAEISVLQN